MSGLREVDCSGCGRHHAMSVEQARKQRVLRCPCGQFVRMDRALAERRSEPAPAFAPARTVELEHARSQADDQQAQLLDSFAAAAVFGRPRPAQPSRSGREPKSQPPPRARMPSLSLPPPLSRHGSEPPTEKPLWYVDLGGIETVEMTIEQLILARRSGKLGEGALVWRTGMPSWRPVGTLIPAVTRASTTPPPFPEAPSAWPPPPPAPALEPAPAPLGSYEKPVATLEFALERPGAATRDSGRPPIPPSRERGSQPRRALTPIPPRPSSPAPPLALTPIPKPASWTSSTSVVAPLPIPRSSAAMAAVTLPPSSPSSTRPLVGERPRWLTASLALLLCVAASGSGAFLVRALRAHRQPAQLSPVLSTPAPAVSGSSAPVSTELFTPVVPQASATPRVVDVTSLTVEHKAPHAAPRPLAPPASKPSSSVAPSAERSDADQTQPELVPAAPTTTQTPTNNQPAPTAQPNPDPTPSSDDERAKQAPSGDQPGF